MSFGNPIEGYLHPKGWVPDGSLEMYVIRDCADHQATNQGCALDINNGRCDGKVLASKSGEVIFIDQIQGIVRIKHPDGSVSGYAHMSPILVALWQQVYQGQQIGEIGDAHDPSILNFSGCHLHFAIQLTANGPEVDPWPYMNAQEEPMPAFKTVGDPIGSFTFVGSHALISPLDTKVIFVQPADAGPFDVFASLDLKTPDGKPVDLVGNSPPLNNRDQVYLVDGAGFGVAAYALRSDGTFTPKAPPDTTAAFNAGVDAAAAQAQTAKK